MLEKLLLLCFFVGTTVILNAIDNTPVSYPLLAWLTSLSGSPVGDPNDSNANTDSVNKTKSGEIHKPDGMVVNVNDNYETWVKDENKNLSQGGKKIVTAKGVVQYKQMGDVDSDNPIILIVHGGIFCYDSISIYCDFYDKENFTLLCPSRSGYSPNDNSVNVTFEEQANILAAFLDALHIPENKKIFVVAASAGGPIAINFVANYQDRVCGLIMQDAISKYYAMSTDGAASFLGKMNENIDNCNFMYYEEKIVAQFDPISLFTEYLKVVTLYDDDKCTSLAYDVMKQLKQQQKMREFVKVTSPLYPYRFWGVCNDMNQASLLDDNSMEELLSKITVPTLVTHSRIDGDVPYEHGEFTVDSVGGDVELYAFDGCGHLFWFGPEWDAIYEKTVDFIKDNGTATP